MDMKGMTTLLVAGIFVATSATTLFAQQQQQQPPPKPKPAQVQPAPKPATAPTAQAHAPQHMRPRWTMEQIKEAQTGLAAAKLYTGKISGQYDSGTRRAVREFQRAHSLPVTGNLSDSLLVLLKEQKPKS
jgi:peptidoglycan hydrolase-like protein with peptidoglycan-binding domain